MRDKIKYISAASMLSLACLMGCESGQKEERPIQVETESSETVETNLPEDGKEIQTSSLSTAGADEANSGEEQEGTGEDGFRIEEYGWIEEKKQEFFEEGTKELTYYYNMEQFFVKDTLENADKINRTLQEIYKEYETAYINEAENNPDTPEGGQVPYSYWHILQITYVGQDYISILYNDVYYMGGAHPYSQMEGITIDCKTGEQVAASQFIEKEDGEILAEVSETMGLESLGTWEDIDFYLTDSTIVFFYRMPNFWDDVEWERPK